MKSFKRLLVGQEGASMVEYGLLVALIAVLGVVAINTLGVNLGEVLEHAGEHVLGGCGHGH